MLNYVTSMLSAIADEPAKPAVEAVPLTPLGWLFMIVSVGFVVVLTLWCFTKVLSLPTDPAEVVDGD